MGNARGPYKNRPMDDPEDADLPPRLHGGEFSPDLTRHWIGAALSAQYISGYQYLLVQYQFLRYKLHSQQVEPDSRERAKRTLEQFAKRMLEVKATVA